MKCALWLGGKKVTSASEIPENFDISAVRGYFLGGCLSEWLSDNGGSDYAAKIDELSPKDEHLNEKLMAIFGQAPQEIKLHVCNADLSRNVEQTAPCSFDEQNGSFAMGSFSGDSFSFSESSFGSYSLGSFGVSSFASSSFGFGSYTFGSFGSYLYGSYIPSYGSFDVVIPETGEYISYGSRNPDITPCASDGSFYLSDEEYDELVRQSFLRCPLNMFGYGIDNI